MRLGGGCRGGVFAGGLGEGGSRWRGCRPGPRPPPSQATSQHRKTRSAEDILARKELPVQTLCYRAPEVLFGDAHFGQAVDLWSVGLVLAELAGCRFHRQRNTQGEWTAEIYASALFAQLGPPEGTSLTTLLLYPLSVPAGRRNRWPADTLARLGGLGLELLESLLAWEPGHRPQAAVARASSFFSPDVMTLAGTSGDHEATASSSSQAC